MNHFKQHLNNLFIGAVKNNNIDQVNLYLKLGVDINCYYGEALFKAISNNSLKMVKLLLESRIYVNNEGYAEYGFDPHDYVFPLEVAIVQKRYQIIEELLKDGAIRGTYCQPINDEKIEELLIKYNHPL